MSNEIRFVGHLSVWVGHRNFGFITVANGSVTERYFLHKTRIIKGTPSVGALVHFFVSPVKEGANPSAYDAEIVDKAVL
jgi:hypothetical protein